MTETILSLAALHCRNHRDRGPADAVWLGLVTQLDTEPLFPFRFRYYWGRRGAKLQPGQKNYQQRAFAQTAYAQAVARKQYEGYTVVDWRDVTYGLAETVRSFADGRSVANDRARPAVPTLGTMPVPATPSMTEASPRPRTAEDVAVALLANMQARLDDAIVRGARAWDAPVPDEPWFRVDEQVLSSRADGALDVSARVVLDDRVVSELGVSQQDAVRAIDDWLVRLADERGRVRAGPSVIDIQGAPGRTVLRVRATLALPAPGQRTPRAAMPTPSPPPAPRVVPTADAPFDPLYEREPLPDFEF